MDRHIVSFSGGKDSTAMLLKMIEKECKIDVIVFFDTKKEFPEMYSHIKKVSQFTQDEIGIPVTIISSDDNFEDWFYGKWTRGQSEGKIRGFPKVKDPCYWTREAKVKIANEFIKKDDHRYLGIAIDERHREQNLENYHYPLIDWGWTENDCRKFLEKEYPQFYPDILKKFSRTGCWLCPKQSNKSLETLYSDYPELWEKLKKLEKDSPTGFKPNTTLDELERMFEINNNRLSIFDI